jgi:hypothetical protein
MVSNPLRNPEYGGFVIIDVTSSGEENTRSATVFTTFVH